MVRRARRDNRSGCYGVDRDQLADQRYEADKQLEQERYDQSLAWDTENRDYTRAWNEDDREYDRALDKAKTLASVGDFSGYRALGYTDEEISKLSAPYQPSRKIGKTPVAEPTEEEPKAAENPGLRTYEDAVSYLKSNNLSSAEYAGMMTEGEWKRRKDAYRKYGQGGVEVTAYDTYPDYINAYTQYCLENGSR